MVVKLGLYIKKHVLNILVKNYSFMIKKKSVLGYNKKKKKTSTVKLKTVKYVNDIFYIEILIRNV